MRIIKKLKALFFKDEKPISLDITAAEIKEGRAFLHPKDDPNLTYRVRSDDIEIRLSKDKSLTDTDIVVIKKHKKEETPSQKQQGKVPNQNTDENKNRTLDKAETIVYDLNRFKQKTFSVSLYPEEYDILMERIQKYSYKRSEFILASAQTATQGTMAKAQKKVIMVRKEIRKEEKELKLKQKSKVAL